MYKYYIILAVITTILWSCLGPEFDELPFFSLKMEKVEGTGQLGKVTLRGTVNFDGKNSLQQHGFIWSTNNGELDQGRGRLISLGSLSGSPVFETTQDGLALDSVYYFKAYTQDGGRQVFSENTEVFSFTVVLQVNANSTEIFNDQAAVEGVITGLNRLRVSIDDYGHVISSTNQSPTVQNGDTTSFGARNFDGAFFSNWDSLEFNTTYYYRAYIETAGKYYYSNTAVFTVRDGWREIGKFQNPFAKGIASVVDNKAYAGLACQQTECFSLGQFYHANLMVFEPGTNPMDGGWKNTGVGLEEMNRQLHMVSFTIEDKVYFGLGENNKTGGTVQYADDFFVYDATTQSISPLNAPFAFGPRSRAVAFVLNNKAYIGSGIADGDVVLNDFYEFDPARSNPWKPVASLPLVFEGAVYNEVGRSEAFSFVIGSQAYVGAGQSDGALLNDCWRFTAPSGTDTLGKWERMPGLPGLPRRSAVAFALENGKGYVGTGLYEGDVYLNDHWEFNPQLPQPWVEKTQLPSTARAEAIGFGIGQFGYLAGGTTRLYNKTENRIFDRALADFWQYIPEKN